MVHILDGDGIWAGTFIDGPPMLGKPLSHVWQPNENSDNGDRLSSSIINKRHPDVFRSVWSETKEWIDLPGLVLSSGEEVERRVQCLGWRDLDSLQYKCEPLGKEGCTPGCPPKEDYCSPRGGAAAQTACKTTGDPEDMPDCCIAWEPAQLKQMLTMQDSWQRNGPCQKDCDNPRNPDAWNHNEIILDKWKEPWEPELPSLIEAVFVSPAAPPSTKLYAQAVHSALLARLGVDGSALPLLNYDPRLASDPFSEF